MIPGTANRQFQQLIDQYVNGTRLETLAKSVNGHIQLRAGLDHFKRVEREFENITLRNLLFLWT